jgi:hypothetical protein
VFQAITKFEQNGMINAQQATAGRALQKYKDKARRIAAYIAKLSELLRNP